MKLNGEILMICKSNELITKEMLNPSIHFFRRDRKKIVL